MAQFIGDELYQVLLGSERAQHLLSHRLALDVVNEIANDLDVYVCFEQREPDLAQRLIDVGFGDASVPAKPFENAFQAIAEGVKHGWSTLDTRKLGWRRFLSKFPAKNRG